MKSDYFIYKYEWPDGCVYIGQSSLSSHRYGYIDSYRGSPKAYRKMKKNPQFEKEILLSNIPENMVDDFEIYYIKLYNSYYEDNKCGLNLTRGGQGGHLHNEREITLMKMNHKGGAMPKRVSKYTLDDKLIDTYKSINDAARINNINKKQISCCCRNIPKFETAGGYHWRYA